MPYSVQYRVPGTPKIASTRYPRGWLLQSAPYSVLPIVTTHQLLPATADSDHPLSTACYCRRCHPPCHLLACCCLLHRPPCRMTAERVAKRLKLLLQEPSFAQVGACSTLPPGYQGLASLGSRHALSCLPATRAWPA